MPTAKRRRSHDDVDDDGDEEIEVESASSRFRHMGHKRTQVALTQERGSSTISDDEDLPASTQYEIDLLEAGGDTEGEEADMTRTMYLEDSDYEAEDDEIDELKATQIVGRHFKKRRLNVAADEGIVEQISCRNFMCHSNLTIDLGPNINFIVGHNGSGKSAGLTALTMCLGGKATQTNRGASLKSLIKEGSEKATLAVKIKNQGENAYKPKEYGKSIIIERRFSRAGSSGFKIKNESGHLMSAKKSDVDDILDFFGLQLDNPINVLTQDMARQFLSNSTPEQKYKLFIKGTQLETLDADYKLFEEHLDGMNDKLRLRKDDIAVLKQKHEEAEARRRRFENVERLSARCREVERQHAWAQVGEQEQLLQKYKGEVNAVEKNIDELSETAKIIDDRYEATETARQATERAVQQQQGYLDPAEQKRNAAKEMFDANKELIIKEHSDERSIRDTRKGHIKTIENVTKAIEDENSRLSEQGGALHIARLAELEQLAAELDSAQEAEELHRAQLPALQEAENQALEEHNMSKQPLKEAETALQAAEGGLTRLEREENRKWAPFPKDMEKLCGEIDRETRWRSKPVGPLGMYVELLKPEWSSVLETTFGGALNGFVVTCKDDVDMFNQIARRVCSNGNAYNTYITRPQPIDTTGKEPDAQYDTLLRVLKISDPMVRNTLIIHHTADQTVLIKDREDAYKFMFESAGQQGPNNVKVTLSLTDDRDISGHRWDFSRSRAQRGNPVRVFRNLPRMQTDRAKVLQLQYIRVDDAKRAMVHARENSRRLRDVWERTQQAVEQHKRRAKALEIAKQDAQDSVEAKEADIADHRPRDGRLQELTMQLKEAEDGKQSSSGTLEDCLERKSTLDATAQELKAALDAAQDELNLVTSRIESAKQQNAACEATRAEVLLETNTAHDNVEFAKRQKDGLQQKVERQQIRVTDYIAQAEGISPRVAVPPNLTLEILEDRLDKLREEHAREERRMGRTREEVIRDAIEREAEYNKAQSESEDLLRISQQLKEALKERHRRWGLFRKYISARARINFTYLLSERNFRGRVLLDHTAKALDIFVEPDISKKSDSGRQTKTLSGGEKSFSTICLLLSIWEAMGSPIRCLDEFDVFMDSVNRSQSMSLMIQAARNSVGKQFILITPQAMGAVSMGDDVRVHKMSDPERGQTSLNFQGQRRQDE